MRTRTGDQLCVRSVMKDSQNLCNLTASPVHPRSLKSQGDTVTGSQNG